MSVVYGIDTGSYKLRIASMEGSFGRFAAREVTELIPALAEDGSIVWAEALQRYAAADPAWVGGEKVAAWPADLGVVRLVRLPFLDKTAIARALPAEVESQVPYNLDDMVLTTRFVDSREGQSRTAAFIAPRAELSSRLSTLQGAGVDPKVLPFDVAVLSAYADRGVQVVVDVGHRRTLLAVCLAGQLVAGRVIASGGAAITAALAHAGSLEWAEAEAQKHALRVPAAAGEALAEWDGDRTDTALRVDASPTAALLGRALRDAVAEWVAEVRAELISVEDEVGVGIDEVLLCGGGSRLQGLGELLGGQLGVPVRPVVVPGGNPVDAALAVGLARVAAGDLKLADLRVEAFAYHGTTEALWNFVSYATVTAAIALVAGAALFGVRWWDARQRLAELDTEIGSVAAAALPDVPLEALTDAETTLGLLKAEVTDTQDRVAVLGATVSGVPPTLELLKRVSERMPAPKDARIDVRELTLSEQSVSFKAETDSYESAARIEEALQSDPSFKEASKADEKKVGEGLSFSVTIPLATEDGAAAGEEG